MKHYWYTTCPNCNYQGRLMIMKNLSSGKLYLHCEECESGWNDPLRVGDLTARFLTLNEEFDAEVAAWEEIEKTHWQAYASHVTEQ
ncbi:MAG TPA: hypothetical protein VFE62_02920 [Gemmataceae bacterium]|nr:hypothetical protein [Gemmataceae bacterium]